MTDLFDKRIARAILLSLWALYACIGPGMSSIDANSISRIGLVFAIVERHTLDIDPIAQYTIDKAEFGGHTYLDKAPGLSFMAVPAVAVIHALATRLGMPTVAVQGESFSIFYLLSVWAGVVFSAALFTAAAAAMMYRLARHLGAGRGAALFGALVFALCTPAFGWATAFFGHGVAGACLLMGFALIVFASDGERRRHQLRLAFLAGASLAWSVVVEYTSAPAVLVIAAAGCWRLRGLPSARRLPLLAAALCGGVVGALPLAIYNLLAFGSVAHVGYSDVVGFDGMQTGLFGVSLPRADIALALLGGTRRGILWIAPILLVAPLAWIAAWRRFGAALAMPLVAIPVAYLLINSGYVYWDGGESTGPRHITPMLPFIALALVPLWQMAGPRMRGGLLALAGVSFALSLMCAVTMMTCPTFYAGVRVQNELTDYILPAFFSGGVHLLLAPVGTGSPRELPILLIPVCVGVLASRVLPLLRRRVPRIPVAATAPA